MSSMRGGFLCVRCREEASGDEGKVHRVTPSSEGRGKHFTYEFEAFAVTLMREMLVNRAGHILCESDSRMWQMLSAHVEGD
jgi:hypothetical protein